MSKSGIYKITNTLNGHRYVGSAVSLTRRWNKHRSDFRKGINSPHLQHAWDKYGEGAFEFHVIGTCAEEDLLRLEQECIDHLRPEYNISPTAGSSLGVSRSLETRAKMSVAKKGKKKAPFSPEARANMSAAQIGRTHPPETRAKIGAARKGKKRAPFSPETRAKIGAARKRYWAAQRPAASAET